MNCLWFLCRNYIPRNIFTICSFKQRQLHSWGELKQLFGFLNYWTEKNSNNDKEANHLNGQSFAAIVLLRLSPDWCVKHKISQPNVLVSWINWFHLADMHFGCRNRLHWKNSSHGEIPAVFICLPITIQLVQCVCLCISFSNYLKWIY